MFACDVRSTSELGTRVLHEHSKVLSDLVDELGGCHILGPVDGLATADAKGKVLGHVALSNGADDGGLKLLAIDSQRSVVVQDGSLVKSAGPSEYGSDRVR